MDYSSNIYQTFLEKSFLHTYLASSGVGSMEAVDVAHP